MRFIPAGSVAGVTVNEPFFMDSTEVTQSKYKDVTAGIVADPSFTFTGDQLPADLVTWYEAVLYCNALSKREGRDTSYVYTDRRMAGDTLFLDGVELIDGSTNPGYRLPTEEEWEFACRAFTTTLCYWGDDTSDATTSLYARYGHSEGSGHDSPLDVGSLLPNDFGLYDMAGNMWEWTDDNYGSYQRRVFRGGSWWHAKRRLVSDPQSTAWNYATTRMDIGLRTILPAPSP